MFSLADFPEVVGFFSYSRDDDEDFGRQLSSLRDAIQKELAAALGRNKRNFRLWQDQDAIAPGEMWETKIASAINEATFFIPIVTPRAVGSEHCKFEFDAFLSREKALGRKNLIFPILYITVPALAEDSEWRSDAVLSVIGARQFVDWRKHRQWPTETPIYREAIGDFCANIADALREPWISPEERLRQEDDARLRRGADLRDRAEEEARRKQAEEDRERQEAHKRKPHFKDTSRIRQAANSAMEDKSRQIESDVHNRVKTGASPTEQGEKFKEDMTSGLINAVMLLAGIFGAYSEFQKPGIEMNLLIAWGSIILISYSSLALIALLINRRKTK